MQQQRPSRSSPSVVASGRQSREPTLLVINPSFAPTGQGLFWAVLHAAAYLQKASIQGKTQNRSYWRRNREDKFSSFTFEAI